ncbi:MAG: hypothetical protein HZB66_03470, partial [Candidatus Aenigmarchaeota archaeon]|nr:hypothetical protein [Candidatus Aenigmarchaeota archaeon]
ELEEDGAIYRFCNAINRLEEDESYKRAGERENISRIAVPYTSTMYQCLCSMAEAYEERDALLIRSDELKRMFE